MRDEELDSSEEATPAPSQLPAMVAWIIFGVLAFFGPVEPYGLVIRSAYLVIIPVTIWFTLRWALSHWHVSLAFSDRLVSVLWGGLGGAMLVGAYLSSTSAYHQECTQEIMTRGGKECVGDYLPVDGPDLGFAFILVLMSGFAFWIGATKRR